MEKELRTIIQGAEIVKSSELHPQESRPSEIGERFKAALKDTRLFYRTLSIPESLPQESKLAMKSQHAAQEALIHMQLTEALRYCMLLTGIRADNMPVEEEINAIFNFIRSQFGGHTIQEIKLAFDLAMSGKLDIQDAKCYENFSCEYIGRIMSSYRRWADQQIKPEIKKEQKALPEAMKPVDWSDDWQKIISWAQEGSLYIYHISPAIYDWLVNKGELIVSKKEKWEMIEECREAYAVELKSAFINSKGGKKTKKQYDLLIQDDNEWRGDENLWIRVINMSKQEFVKRLAEKISKQKQ